MIYKKHIKPYSFIFSLAVLGYLLFLVVTAYFRNATNATIKQFAEHTNTLYEHPFTVHSNALELKLIVFKMRNENLSALIDTENKVDFGFVTQSDFALIDRRMQEIKKEFLGEKSKAEELQAAVKQWESTVTNFRNFVQAQHTIEARNYLDDKVTPSYQVLSDKLNYILNYSQIKAETIVATANLELVALDKSLFNAYLLLIALMTILGGFGIFYLWRILYLRDKTSSEFQIQQRIAATAFESQEGIIVTDADAHIIRVNAAFTTITGYTADDAIGQTPKLLSSGRQDEAFYNEMWDTLLKLGAWEGEIWNRRKSGETYPEHLTITAVKDEEGIVTHYVASFSDITKSKIATDEIKNLAFYDPLTFIPNRRLFLDRLKQAFASSTRSNKRGAVVFLDIDHFKTINDTLGHDVGDLLLKEVAMRLGHCVRESDTIARLGGDEFVVLLENLSEDLIEAASQAKDMCQKILHSLSQPYLLNTNQHYSTASLGVTLFVDHEVDLEQVIKQADIAMYQSKTDGRNTFSFYDQKMQEIITTRSDMESGLRQAILQKQFELHYHVQEDRSGNPVGAEALIRWRRTKRKLTLPVDFIPLAEETGTILQIGQWVLEAACQQLAIWRLNPLYQDMILSINISAKQLIQKDFVTQVQDALQRHEIEPSKLKLELTESIMINDFDTIIANMQALFAFGVGFSLDDFGTGYSSLQYLKKLPLSQFKIDKSFVNDIAVDKSDFAISRTIIAMAYSLELSVIAEGVETEEQKQCLMDLNCMYFQGYLFGKPMPIHKFEASLRKV
jgi:diguanylate cyclase (GGDEF)-like protein/PAS domain S-box-containing protein